MDFDEFVVSDESVIFVLKHPDQSVQTLGHLASAVVFYDERHLELGMVVQLIELPRMEIGHEISVLFKHPSNHPVINSFRKVVKGKPEQGKPHQWSHGCWYLHHAVLVKPCPWSLEVHVSAGNECRIQ